MLNTLKKNNNLKIFNLNFGPQHPSAHGVLRLVLEMDGEKIINAIPHIGLLHRGTEKLIETKMFLQALPYFDRLDYVSMMSQEHCFCLVIEQLLNINVPLRAQIIRIIYLEITRILNHLMAITTHAMDVGALTPFLWAFEEREKLMTFYENISGARMHANYFRPGGVAWDIPQNLLNEIYYFTNDFVSRINELDELLTWNRIWNLRLKKIGIISQKNVLSFGLSGVLARGSGLQWDLRKKTPYESYKSLKFNIPIGKNGDCFDRYLIRIEEMRQSLKIIKQCLIKLPLGIIKNSDLKLNIPQRQGIKNFMELLIQHFKYFSQVFKIKNNEIYNATEAPKGEFGIFLVTNNTNKAYRCKIRAPGFFSLQSIGIMAQEHLLADVVTVIGTQDIVFGEVDR